jgi:inward rectifier potassium channel
MNWVLLHAITEESPLYKRSLEDWDTHGMQILISINAHDNVYQQQMHQSYVYLVNDVLENHIFEDMICVEEHRLVMDMSKIHSVRSLVDD